MGTKYIYRRKKEKKKIKKKIKNKNNIFS